LGQLLVIQAMQLLVNGQRPANEKGIPADAFHQTAQGFRLKGL